MIRYLSILLILSSCNSGYHNRAYILSHRQDPLPIPQEEWNEEESEE